MSVSLNYPSNQHLFINTSMILFARFLKATLIAFPLFSKALINIFSSRWRLRWRGLFPSWVPRLSDVWTNNVGLVFYTKPTFTGRYINFYSNHQLKQKINTLAAMCKRINRISHPTLLKRTYHCYIPSSSTMDILTTS